VPGIPDAQRRAQHPYTEEKEIVQSGYTLISYTDGICDRDGFDQSRIENLMSSKQDLNMVVNKIFQYADTLTPFDFDDATLIAVRLK
jgi:hypothetical protein